MKKDTALIVVDLNNDFMKGGALAIPGAEELISPINQLAKSSNYAYVVAVQDWHPKGHCSFKYWPEHCVIGSHGAMLNPAFNMNYAHALIRKGFCINADSYGAFYDEHGQTNGLGELLKARSITHIDIVGLATDYCVKETAIQAVTRLHLQTHVLLSACRGVELHPGDTAKAIIKMRNCGVQIIQHGKAHCF